jgi:hypothetical protein
VITDVMDFLPDDERRMWTEVDGVMLGVERHSAYAEVFGPDRSAGWDVDDDYDREAA